jgi:NAD(P)-dependent dehydrogenase (short-subunit alcohol dehydrogenase family)
MKTVIITGASSGFGLITAKNLAIQGYKVFAAMRNTKSKNAFSATSLLHWAAEKSYYIDVVDMDVTSDVSVKTAVDYIARKSDGIIDVLINNAGLAYIGLNETLSASQTNQIFQVNVIAVDRMIKAVLPFMHRQKDGLLITISSVAARQATPVMGIYAASKAAVDALSVSYSYELKSSGIDVVNIQPGAYQTTDIVVNQMAPENPSAEINYGIDMIRYKNSVLTYFEAKDSSRNPEEIASEIALIISMPSGKRPLWSIIGAGDSAEIINNINSISKQLIDDLVVARA